MRNAQIRWEEHEAIDGKSEPAKHLVNNNNHRFNWTTITRAPMDSRKRKIMEAYHINKFLPDLNEQIETRSLNLFRNGIT